MIQEEFWRPAGGNGLGLGPPNCSAAHGELPIGGDSQDLKCWG